MAVDEIVHPWAVGLGLLHDGPMESPGRSVSRALQRPDFHLFGTATSPEEAAGLIEVLRNQLSVNHYPEGAPE
jgi:hypothetical protein